MSGTKSGGIKAAATNKGMGLISTKSSAEREESRVEVGDLPKIPN